jgi:ABC-2 type transport system ATP-binding protein
MKELTVEVKNLTKKFKVFKTGRKLWQKKEYKEVIAVNDISFEVARGEFVGFIGPNGAGKTTTLKCLSGLLTPDGGDVEILGYTPSKKDNEFLQRISLVMGQKSQLWWELPPMDTFLLNKEIYQVGDKEFKEITNELIKLLEVEDIMETQVRKLSLGQRMKCEIISSLLHNPELLFLDEPTVGLDVVSQYRLRDFFKKYNKRYKTTVLLTSHNMDDVKNLCKRVIVINKGEIIFDGKITDLVKKYVNKKYVSFVTKENILKEDFEKYGEVLKLNGRVVSLSVDREESTNIVSDILKKYKIDDLDIEEPRLEDVVKGIFES